MVTNSRKLQDNSYSGIHTNDFLKNLHELLYFKDKQRKRRKMYSNANRVKKHCVPEILSSCFEGKARRLSNFLPFSILSFQSILEY
jgi:hypothetical protein